MVTHVDPVATGIVTSWAWPGGNITGLTRFTRKLSGKRLELLKEAVPTPTRVGVLVDVGYPDAEQALQAYETAARVLKITLHAVEVRSATPDFAGAFHAAAQEGRINALVVETPLTHDAGQPVAEGLPGDRSIIVLDAIAGITVVYRAQLSGRKSQVASQPEAVSREAGVKPALPRNCKRNAICEDH
jgi:hypothetical protein